MHSDGYVPDFKEFCALAKQGNLIPVSREVLADFETPVSALAKIDRGPCSYLLESVEGGEKWARYSFLGSGSPILLYGSDREVVLSAGRRRRRIPVTTDVLACLRDLMAEYRPVEVPGLPRFCGGAVGYLSYDVVRQFERLPSVRQDVLGLPLMCFLFTDTLLVINPSPYMYYLRFPEVELVGASPEVLVRCEDDLVQLRPIAGTRRRGATEEEDRALREELLANAKERAEHVMLVDLGRNDVGRVARPGTVRVKDFMVVEQYSHVMHLVSQVEGRLAPGRDAYDVLRACFPAGTVSGAPKIRAMEIIEELEPSRRGPYAGAVGYFGFSGNMDTCINIRTVVIKGRQAFIQAGAGIVADSDPEAEYVETCNKAKAMMRAVEMAERGLD